MPGHPRPTCGATVRTWMPGTRPGMTRIESGYYRLLCSHLRLAVADAIDGTVIVVGDQDRAVLELQHVDRPADIFVVFQESGDQRLDGFDRAILVQLDDDNVTA